MQLDKKYLLVVKFLNSLYTYEFRPTERKTEDGFVMFQGKNQGKHKKQVLHFTEPMLLKLGAKIEDK